MSSPINSLANETSCLVMTFLRSNCVSRHPRRKHHRRAFIRDFAETALIVVLEGTATEIVRAAPLVNARSDPEAPRDAAVRHLLDSDLTKTRCFHGQVGS